MNLLHDSDADLSHLAGSRIAVIGYGNQGRAQALNLRDSGLEVIIGNIADAYAGYARADGFAVHTIPEAVAQADVVMLLVPDEIMPALFDAEIAPHLKPGAAVDLASGYTVAFGQLAPPPTVDLILLAPRMIGAGVRDLYLAGQGFPAFFGVAQDASGSARDLVLALAKGIGATRMGVVEVTFAQEAELDLFTEQCFGPAFGAVLTASINLLIDAGYPPEAVLLELYMSGEFAYTLGKIAEMGLVEQAVLHSGTSQYGSMSRGMRFQLPELRAKLQEGLAEIRSGAFAREWAEEQAEGSPTLELLKEQARATPLHALEQQLRAALGTAAAPPVHTSTTRRPLLPSLRALLNRGPSPAPNHKPLSPASGATPTPAQPPQPPAPSPQPLSSAPGTTPTPARPPQPPAPSPEPLSSAQLEATLRTFLELAAQDPALQAFARGRDLDSHYVLEGGQSFHLGFHQGAVTGGLGDPPTPAQVRLTLSPATLDGIFTNRLNPARAAMSGDITFAGEVRLALSIQRVQKELTRLYSEARQHVLAQSQEPEP
jgi:ketol-acid reductoisomerase